MTHWTIELDGSEQTCADWGFFALNGSFVNQGADTISFTAREQFDSDAGDWIGSAITVRRDRVQDGAAFSGGSIVFVGTVDEVTRQGEPGSERATYFCYGPWRALEETILGQTWVASGGSLVTSHLLLNRGGLPINDQIGQIITAAVGAGIQIQAGTIDTLPPIPMSEVRDITMGEAIRQQLRWCPDTVTWFDYTTTPPSLNVRRWQNLAAVNLPLDGTVIAGGSLRPRTDLVRPAVVLFFETASEVDGEARMTVTAQKFPLTATGFERRALIGTFDLQGPKIAHETADIIATPIEAKSAVDATRLEWWKQKFPELRSARVSSLSIPTATVKFYTCGVEPDGLAATFNVASQEWDAMVFEAGEYIKRVSATETKIYQVVNDGSVTQGTDPATLPSEFMFIDTVRQEVTSPFANELDEHSAALTRWLEVEQGFTAEKLEVVADVTYTTTDQTAGHIEPVTIVLTHKLMSTNAVTGNYSTVSSIEQGETAPAGLAEHLYGVSQVLHYEGSLRLTAKECPAQVAVGNVVNITGGIYAAAKALVQELVIDVDDGVTSVKLGPPGHLGPQDLIEWVRAFRTRRIWTNPATQDDGQLAKGANEVGKKGPAHNSSSGATTPTRIYMTGAGGSVDIDPTDSNGKTIELRQLSYCDDGVEKYIMVLASAPYV